MIPMGKWMVCINQSERALSMRYVITCISILFGLFFFQRESVDLAIKLLDESECKGHVIHVEQVTVLNFPA